MADVSTDFDTKEYNCNDPRAYAAKHKLNDPDMPSYSDAVTGKKYSTNLYSRSM